MPSFYFNVSETGSVSSAVATSAVPVAEIITPNPADYFAQIDEINARAVAHPNDVFEHLGLWGQYEGNHFSCPSPSAKNPEIEHLEFNVVSGQWIDHGEFKAGGFGMVGLKAHLEGYTTAESAEILKELLDDLHPAYSPYICPPPDDELKVRRSSMEGVCSPAQEVPDEKATDIWWLEQGIARPLLAFPYRDASGRVVGYVNQYGSSSLPCTLWEQGAAGQQYWQYEYLPGRRPLFNLDQIAAKPDFPILVVGSEAAARAAESLFRFHVAVTFMGGVGAISKADLSPLHGRHVTLWLNDQNAENSVAKLLHAGDATTKVTVMNLRAFLPQLTDGGNLKVRAESLPDNYDAVKAVMDGWTADLIGMLPDDLFQVIKPVFEEKQVGSFLVKADGVYSVHFKDGEEIQSKISSRVEVTALTRDEKNNNWGLLLKFTDRDRNIHEWAMAKELLACKDEYRQVLLARGADIYPSSFNKFSEYLLEANPSARALCVSSQGWHGNVYALPDKTYGKNDEQVILQTAYTRKVSPYGVKGTLADWQDNVGNKCVGNSRLVLAVCVSLTGPFLEVLQLENGGFHYRGQSSSGKTKTLSVAASVHGGKGMVGVWRATGNAIEGIARERNDSVLLLDELGQVSPQEAGDIAYMLGNGQTKARSNVNGDAKAVGMWRLLFQSTGEIGLAEHVKSGGGTVRAGMEVRMLDIPSDAGAGMGVFEEIHGATSPAAFADSLQTLSEAFYGSPADALLTRITNPGERERAAGIIRQHQRQFEGLFVPVDAHGQVIRAAQRFAAVAGVGEYCISIGILPWAPGHAIWGTGKCFLDWLDSRGDNSASEEIRALAHIRMFLERNSEARFTVIRPDGIEENNIGHRTINRVGFKKIQDDGLGDHWILPEMFKSEVCAGFDPKLVIRVLKDKGFLELDSAGKSSVSKLVPGIGRMRVYVIKASFMQDHQ